MRWRWTWTGIFVAVGLLDYGVRLGTKFNMVWVIRVEAVLFLATSLVLWILRRRNPVQVRWQRAVQLGLVVFFALGGLRSALWAAGLAVGRANIVVLVVGLFLVAEVLRRRYQEQAAA